MAFVGTRRALLGGSSLPRWAAGFDLWYNYQVPQGSYALGFPPATDTHSSTINALTPAGTYQGFAANVPVRTGLGLQTVPTRTNSIRNSSATGAVAGSPGTVPTNWNAPSSASGLSRQIVGTGTDATTGLPYIDIRYSGTANSTTAFFILPDGNTAIAATSGQIWTGSSFISLQAGSLSGFSAVECITRYYQADGSTATGTTSTSIAAVGATPVRYAQTGTAPALTAFVVTGVRLVPINTSVIDFTLRIIAPQLEGTSVSFASPPILTTSGAATVNGNQQVIDLTGKLGAGVSGFIDLDLNGLTSGAVFLSISDGTTNNRMVLRSDGGSPPGSVIIETTTGGVSQGTVSSVTAGTGRKTVAFAAGPNFQQVRVVNGTAPSADTTVTWPTIDRAAIGGQGSTASVNQFQNTRKLALKFGPANQSVFDAAFAAAQLAAVSP